MQDAIDLDSRAFRQLRDTERGACRPGLREVGCHHFIDLREIRKVGEKYGDPHGIFERAARGFCDSRQIIEDSTDLDFDIATDKLTRRRVERNLARNVNRLTHAYGLRVGTDGLRCVGRIDDLSSHIFNLIRRGF